MDAETAVATNKAYAETDGKVTERLLGYTESTYQIYVSKFSTGIYWQVGIINSTKPLQDSVVETTLKILVRKQQILQMRILPVNPDETNPIEFQFQPMDDPEKIDFESVTLRHKDDWPKYISQDHDIHKLDHANGPLWRCIFGHVQADEGSEPEVYEYVVFMKWHHGIADGKSGSNFMYNQFLPILSAIVNGLDAENKFPYVPLTKSVEYLLLSPQKQSNPVPWYVRLALGTLRWKNRHFPPQEKPIFRFPEDELSPDKEPDCVPKVFNAEVTDAVIKAAKTHAVTVHCVLMVAGTIALSRTAEAAGVKLPRTFLHSWPIDLRKFLNYKTPQPLGAIFAVGMTKVDKATDYTSEKFWICCQKVYDNVKEGTRQEKCTAFIGVMKYFLDEHQKDNMWTAVKELAMDPYISLSNMGNVSGDSVPELTEGPVKLQMIEQFFSLSGLLTMTVLPFLQLLLTFEGRFMWNIVYSPKLASRKFIDTYYENLEDVIRTYCMQ